MKVGPPLMVPLRPATSGLTAPFGRWVASPKGKLKVEEPLEAAALREVQEETGQRCLIARSLGTIEYIDRRGTASHSR